MMSCAHSVLVPPWIACLLGIVAGVVSTFGEYRLTSWLENGFKIYDTQGVLFTIVIPASLGFLVSEIVTAAAVGQTIWGSPSPFVSSQSGFLAASWALALAFALLFGAATGFIFRFIRQSPRKNQMWREDNTFIMPGDYAAY